MIFDYIHLESNSCAFLRKNKVTREKRFEKSSIHFVKAISFNPTLKEKGLYTRLYQGLEKSRSISNPRKISGSANLVFFQIYKIKPAFFQDFKVCRT